MVARLTVRAEHDGLRADRVVAELANAAGLEGVSRAEVQRWMTAGRVRSATGPLEPKTPVRAGQVIEVEPALPEPSAAVPEIDVAFEVVHVDDDVVVVDKPAGLVVHPAAGHARGTLVNGLLGRGLFARDVVEDEHDRPGIVHRIDKDTSGLLVVARNAMAREHLKAQFAAHSVERMYDALAWGAVETTTYATLHGRDPRERVKFSSRVREGKRAVTHVSCVRRGALATHLHCRLETGRTHQIRVHLADAGHSLVADALYGKTPRGGEAMARAIGRQALHAGVLGFVHPRSGAPLRFSAPLPADFRRALSLF